MPHEDPVVARQRGSGLGLLARQGSGYLVVGVVQLGLDWGMFVLLSYFGIAVSASNLIARASGAVVGFWLNATYTFRGSDGSLSRGWDNGARFLVAWVVMAAVSTLCVSYLSSVVGLHWAWLGKPLIDGALAALGFLLSKYWVFR